MRQTIGNACGTIGVIHAVGNNLHQYEGMRSDCYFSEFFARTKNIDPDERAAYLESDDSLEAAHGSAVAAGETECPTADDEVNLHFVALVHVDGGLYELDGRKATAVRHGTTSAATLLQDAVPVIKKFVDRAEGNVNFNAIPAGGAGVGVVIARTRAKRRDGSAEARTAKRECAKALPGSRY